MLWQVDLRCCLYLHRPLTSTKIPPLYPFSIIREERAVMGVEYMSPSLSDKYASVPLTIQPTVATIPAHVLWFVT